MKPWKVIALAVAIAWTGDWLLDTAQTELLREAAERCEAGLGQLMSGYDGGWYCVRTQSLLYPQTLEVLEQIREQMSGQ